MIARDLMTPNPETVTPDATIAEVWDLMRELDIRHIPVVQGGVLVGMLSDRDLAHLDVGRVLTVEGADALRRELATPVVKVEHRVGAIPVVRPDTREVLGIISYVDVLRALQDLLEER